MDADAFGYVLDALLPEPENGLAVMLSGYADASRLGGLVCVAAVAYRKKAALKCRTDWNSIYGRRGSHWTELNSKHGGRYAELSKDQRNGLVKGGITTIKKHASFYVAVSAEASDIDELKPRTSDPRYRRELDGFRTPYAFMLHMALSSLGMVVADAGIDDEIIYFIENGDEGCGQATSFIRYVAGRRDDPSLKHLYRYRSDAGVSKEDCPLAATADAIAWEWNAYREYSLPAGRIRGSFAALSTPHRINTSEGIGGSNFMFRHYSRTQLTSFFEKLETFVLSDPFLVSGL